MRIFKYVGYAVLIFTVMTLAIIFFLHQKTQQEISALQSDIQAIALKTSTPSFDKANLNHLPKPVQRYFSFVFHGEVKPYYFVKIQAQGDFRRPLTEDFNPTDAEQFIAIGQPALMFSATTHLSSLLWAQAYDFFAQGKMTMKAKVLSAFTVVDEHESKILNQISLRRWLLESPLYPQALLPGGSVTWQAIDDYHARATVSANVLSASMIAHFDEKGRLTHMVAEEDGDLTTPYHGSGEHVTRSDYRLVNSMMIPHTFRISRMAKGKVMPFWKGSITEIEFFDSQKP